MSPRRIRYPKHTLIDAGPAREHLQWLRDQGMGLERIARVTGLNVTWLFNLSHSTGPAHEGNIEILLGLTDPSPAPLSTVDAAPVRDHIRALLAAGMSYDAIAAQARRSGATVRSLASGTQPTVTRDTADEVLAVTPTSANPDALVERAVDTLCRLVADPDERTLFAAMLGVQLPNTASDDDEDAPREGHAVTHRHQDPAA